MAERRFTDLELERALAHDLPAERAASLEREATAADRARLDELRTEHAAFLGSVDVDAEVRAIGARLATEPRAKAPARQPAPRWYRWAFAGGGLAVAAMAVALLIVPREDGSPIREDDRTAKGEAISLVIHAATGAQSRRLQAGDTVTPGTRIRFELQTLLSGYAAVIGIDGRGAGTVYYPRGGEREAAPVTPSARVLPGAIELDDAPGDEQFFAVFSPRPFSPADLVQALRERRPLPGDVSSAAVVLHKAAP